MRKQYSKSELKDFLEQNPLAQLFVTKKSQVVEENNYLYVDNALCFFKLEETTIWIPTLPLLISKKVSLPKLVVDKGAIPFVLKGADIMRPGVVTADEFIKNAIVMIVDETMHQPIGVAKTLYCSQELLLQKTGKVAESLHFYGDEKMKNKN
jgi:predicted RNA-binding protein (TIGR00451 family)